MLPLIFGGRKRYDVYRYDVLHWTNFFKRSILGNSFDCCMYTDLSSSCRDSNGELSIQKYFVCYIHGKSTTTHGLFLTVTSSSSIFFRATNNFRPTGYSGNVWLMFSSGHLPADTMMMIREVDI